MDIVHAKLKEIQYDYLQILKRIKLNININFKASIDEINLFWLKNKKFVLFLLSDYFCPYNTILFTGATYLDCKQNEQFPFIVCDGFHIVDDNVSSYGNIIDKIDDEIFNNSIRDQFMAAIDDDIFILENYSNYIYILPVHYLCDEEDNVIKSAENIFLKLFQPNFSNLGEYFAKVQTISDLEEYLIPNVEKSLILYENDSNNIPLQERIENYIISSKANLDLMNKSTSYVFFSSVFSHISQTLSIINICLKYQLIPYLRYNVAFHYFCHLIENFNRFDKIDEIKNKSITCYLIHKSFDLTSVNASIFGNFVKKIKEKEIYKNLYKEISDKNNKINNISNIVESLKQEFDALIIDCNSSN